MLMFGAAALVVVAVVYVDTAITPLPSLSTDTRPIHPGFGGTEFAFWWACLLLSGVLAEVLVVAFVGSVLLAERHGKQTRPSTPACLGVGLLLGAVQVPLILEWKHGLWLLVPAMAISTVLWVRLAAGRPDR